MKTSFSYIFWSVIIIGTAFCFYYLPKSNENPVISPNEVLHKLDNTNRFVTTHQVAKRIIANDPGILLVDVRYPRQFEAYSIPGAINIPMENLMDTNWTDSLNRMSIDIVLYSNGDMVADQAWVLLTEHNAHNLYVLKGGLNKWFETIIKPTPPNETASAEAFEQYSFEKGASIYFGGSPANLESTSSTAKKEVVVRKKKKRAAEGGC